MSALVWGTARRSPSPQAGSPAPPGLRRGVAGWGAVWCPKRPSCPFSAPTDRRRAKLGPHPPGDSATWKRGFSQRPGAASAPRRLTHRLRHFPLPLPQPRPPGPPAAASPPPPLQPLAPAGCRSSSYFLPGARPVQQGEVVLIANPSPGTRFCRPEVPARLSFASSSFYPKVTTWRVHRRTGSI